LARREDVGFFDLRFCLSDGERWPSEQQHRERSREISQKHGIFTCEWSNRRGFLAHWSVVFVRLADLREKSE
jgi:hypothetical protein